MNLPSFSCCILQRNRRALLLEKTGGFTMNTLDLDRVRALAARLSNPDVNDDGLFQAVVADYELVTNTAEFARKYGMSRSTISRWKGGHSVPHPALRPRIYQWLRKLANMELAKFA